MEKRENEETVVNPKLKIYKITKPFYNCAAVEM
jgi:hypothetical protein